MPDRKDDAGPAEYRRRVASVQETYAPTSTSFCCGPRNERGLRLGSRWEGDVFVAAWRGAPHHEAFPGVLAGGVVGALLDCHSNWCAATTLMRDRRLDRPPATVTAEYAVKLRRPAPADREVRLTARPVSVEGDRVAVDAELSADGTVCATCRGVFVVVAAGHPAYHRWE